MLRTSFTRSQLQIPYSMTVICNYKTGITVVYTYLILIISVSTVLELEHRPSLRRADTLRYTGARTHTHTGSVLAWRGDDVVGARQTGKAAVLWAEVDVLWS